MNTSLKCVSCGKVVVDINVIDETALFEDAEGFQRSGSEIAKLLPRSVCTSCRHKLDPKGVKSISSIVYGF